MRSATSNSNRPDWGDGSLPRFKGRKNGIVEFPESAPEIASGIRKCVLRKFRFSLIYSIERDSLLVLAVAHQSRRPGYWFRRVGRSD